MITIRVSFNGEELKQWTEETMANLQYLEKYFYEPLKEELEEIADEVRARAPVRTGQLYESVRVEDGDETLSFWLKDDPKTISGEGYARFPEFGTDRQLGQYFVSDSLVEGIPRLEDRIKDKAKEIFQSSK